MRKLSRVIHLWLSIPSGVLIFIVCLTGAILTFEEEILHLQHPYRFAITVVSENATPLTIGELMPRIASSLNEGEVVSNIRIYDSVNQPYLVSLEGKKGEQLFFNPYTGELIERVTYSSTFFGKSMLLHRWLMLTGKNMKAGKLIIGTSTIALTIIILSGIVIWLPKKKKHLKEGFKIKFSKNRFLLDLHKVLGIYSSLLLLIMALTGLMWSFPVYKNAVSKLFNASDLQVSDTRKRIDVYSKKTAQSVNSSEVVQGKHTENEVQSINSSEVAQGELKDKSDSIIETNNSNQINVTKDNAERNYSAWDNALSNVRLTGIEYKQIQLSKNSISVLPHDAWNPRAMDTYTFDVVSGELKDFTSYSAKKRSSKVMSTAYALHTGRFWGFSVKLLYFLVALIGASLPVTGYWLYINKHFRRKKK